MIRSRSVNGMSRRKRFCITDRKSGEVADTGSCDLYAQCLPAKSPPLTGRAGLESVEIMFFKVECQKIIGSAIVSLRSIKLYPEPPAIRACAVFAVEGKEARIQFGIADAALGTCEFSAEKDVPFLVDDVDNNRLVELSAVSIACRSCFSIECLMMKRSITISIVWRDCFLSAISCVRSIMAPSIRARTKPSIRIFRSSFLYSPLRSRTIGERIWIFERAAAA